MHTAADLFDAGSSRRRRVRLRVQGAQLLVTCDEETLHSLPLAQVRISPRLAAVPRQLHLPDGALLSVADHAFVDSAFPPPRRARWIDAVERRWHWLLLLTGVTLALTVAAYRSGLPWAAEKAAAHIPAAYVRSLSEEVYDKLIADEILVPSVLSAEQQARARRLFDEIAAPGLYLKFHRLTFFGDVHLANAFAFPDGMIILTDEIVLLLGDDELRAVLAHEAGHVHHRHGLRQMLQALGVSAFVFFIIGDFSGMSLVPIALANSHYSRAFERDADCYAAAQMLAQDKSPELIAAALRKIEAQMEKDMQRRPRWLQAQMQEEEDVADADSETGADAETDAAADADEDAAATADAETDADAADAEASADAESDATSQVLERLVQVLSTHPQTEERTNLAQACGLR